MEPETPMYAKLFASLYQGTLRGNSHGILVFTNLLAHADRDGYVDKHFRAIADEVGLSVEEVKAAIEMLESPDGESRSSELEGRRITRINDHRAWGWHVVNYAKYREIRNDEDRREQNRLAQQRWRERNSSKPSVSTRNGDKPMHRDTEMQTERKKEYSEEFVAFWKAYPRKVAKPDAWKAWRKIKPAIELESMLRAIQDQSAAWVRDNFKFTPYPATWLNDRRWEDEAAPSRSISKLEGGGF